MRKHFTIPILVEVSDIDELGHVGNATYLRWVTDVTRAHNSEFGLGQNYLIESGTVFVVQSYELTYMMPLKIDDEAVIQTWIETWNGFYHVRGYKVSFRNEAAVAFLAIGKWVHMSIKAEKISRLCGEAADKLGLMASEIR